MIEYLIYVQNCLLNEKQELKTTIYAQEHEVNTLKEVNVQQVIILCSVSDQLRKTKFPL